MKRLFLLIIVLPLMALVAWQSPEDPIPPSVIDVFPASGMELGPNEAISLTFNQPMDQRSVEQALRFEPEWAGVFEWVDDRLVHFLPETFVQGQQYSAMLSTDARAANGVRLTYPFQFEVQTIHPLAVGDVSPLPDSVDVVVDSQIIVSFSRPIVPLASTSEVSGFEAPILIDPLPEGKGEWVNTSLYVFTPSRPLNGGTAYTITAPAGLTSIDGAYLPDDFTWGFRTIGPKVLDCQPLAGYDGLRLDRPVILTFSQSMDSASTQAAFRLFLDDEERRPVTGTFSWDETHTVLTFQPDDRLGMDMNYRVELGQTALNVSRDAGLVESFSIRFYTVAWPRVVVPFNPREQWGGITIQFASAMNMNSLRDRVRIEPEPEEWWPEVWSDNYIHFAFVPLAGTTYTLTVLAGAEDVYGNPITEDYSFSVDYQPVTSNYINLYREYGIRLLDASQPDASFDVTIRGRPEAAFELYRLDSPDYYPRVPTYQDEEEGNPHPVTGTLIRSWQQTFSSKTIDNERVPVFLASESGGQLPLGLYRVNYDFLTADHRGQERRKNGAFQMLVANVTLTLKPTPDDILIWVTDLLTGEPRPGVPVTLYNRGVSIGQGRSDADGIVRLSLESLPELVITDPDKWFDPYPWVVWAVAQDENVFGYWESFGVTGLQQEIMFLYTERNIYRPGETVYFRGVLRNRDDMAYSIPPLETLQITSTIYSQQEGGPQKSVLFDQAVTVSPFGTFSGEFTLPEDAPLGYAGLFTGFDEPHEFGGTSISFTIAEYRVPEYHVKVTPENSEILRGEPVRAVVEAAYYAGGPVSDAAMEWIAVGNAAYFPYHGRGRYHFIDSDARPRTTWDGVFFPSKVFTNAQGQYQIEFELDEAIDPYPLVIDFQAQVYDETGQRIAARNTVLVHPAEVYIGLRAQSYFGDENRPVTVEAIAVTPDSTRVANQPMTVSAVELRWHRQEIPDEWGRYTWEREEVEIAAGEIETDANGAATYTFTPPRAGIYRIRAETVDAAGRPNRSSINVWVRGQNRLQWGAQKNHEVIMIPDQDSYRPGETAQVLIPIPFMDEGRTTVLVSVERGDIFTYEVFQAEGPADNILYELPLTPEHAPNVYLSVLMIQSASGDDPLPDYRQGQIRLDVEPVDRLLTVTLTPDKAAYHPRDEAVFDVLVTDWEGNPVPDAEVGLSLTDKAVLDLRPPYSESYGGGCGRPTRFAPLEEPISPIVAAFYGPQRNAIRTEFSLPALPDIDRSEGDPGGGCGGGGGSGFVSPLIRTDFVTTPLWEAHLVTDETGQTQARVTLPDNLTLWQLNAIVLTADTRVGQAKIEVVSSLPLRVRPVTPRFFVAGDQVDLGAIVHNSTESPQTVDVYLEADGVEIESDNPQTVTLLPETRVEVSWRVLVNDVPGVDLTFSAISDSGLSDAAKPALATGPNNTIPVYRYTATDTVGTAGLLLGAESRLEGISLPPRFDPDRSELTISVIPSLVSPIMDGLTYLEIYPHYCIEQTVSRFLPNAVIARMLRTAGVTDVDLEASLDRSFTQAMSKIAAAQNGDGGWGWFGRMKSDPLVTAYVMLGLSEAREAGLEVDEKMFSAGLTALREAAGQPLAENASSWALNRRAFQLFVLARVEDGDRVQMYALFEQREKLSYEGYAYLLLAFAEDFPEDAAADVLLSDLISGAIISATGVHWEETTRQNWGSDTRTTALILSALVRYQPDHVLLPNVVRWLLIARQGDHWISTQETAWTIMGLADWIAYTDELNGSYSYRVRLNDEPVIEAEVTPASVRDENSLHVAVRDLLMGELNRLSISREDGEGVLYYTAILSLDLPLQDVQATSRGLSISREYFLIDDLETPVTQARVGDTVAVRLTITTSQDLYYAVVEDPVPAGLEILNSQLAITPHAIQPPGQQDPKWRWGWWWFDQIEIRDEQTNLYADFLPRGTYVYTYRAQATASGEFQVIPAQGYAFYQPDIFGRTDGVTFTVLPQ